jgi:hypothetical protein
LTINRQLEHNVISVIKETAFNNLTSLRYMWISSKLSCTIFLSFSNNSLELNFASSWHLSIWLLIIWSTELLALSLTKYSEDCSAFHHAIYGYLIQSNKENAETLYQDLKNKNPQSNYVFMSEILLKTNVLFSWRTVPELKSEKFNDKSILFTVYYY